MPSHHLAQINIGKLAAPIDHPSMREFADNLARINALADQSPGFVWRLEDDTGSSVRIPTPFGPDTAANLSVWRDLESLRLYVYKSDHAGFIRRRSEWFIDQPGAHMALWWIEAGHLPDLHEAKERLEIYERSGGPTPAAFIFSRAFDARGYPVDRHGRPKNVA